MDNKDDDYLDGVLFRFWIRAASYPGGWPSDTAAALLRALVADRDALQERVKVMTTGLRQIENINNGPDKASGEWRCMEAASIAKNTLHGFPWGKPSHTPAPSPSLEPCQDIGT